MGEREDRTPTRRGVGGRPPDGRAAGIVLATRNDAVLDAVESIAAALRIRVQGADDVGGAVAAWASAGTLLVGPDLAPARASEVLRRRPHR
ncbi:MAG: hypothetical protein L0G22_05770, partial [Propionibacteriaceae bacterium]|nr:hypothetical protein [Propionibacteriaceae bacterium]